METSSLQGALMFVSSYALTLCVLMARVSSSSLSLSPKIKKLNYVSYSGNDMPQTLVVDCKHATATQLTHHLKSERQRKLMDLSLRGDSTTDSVINALLKNHKCITTNLFVTCNHFDVDGFISCWCAMNPEFSIENAELMRQCGKIGDFRELSLDSEVQMKALKLVCWLNSEEKRLFYRPFESSISSMDGEEDGESKYNYFLPIFEETIQSIDEPHIVKLYHEEFSRVCTEYNLLHKDTRSIITHTNTNNINTIIQNNIPFSKISESQNPDDRPFTQYADLGLVVVRTSEPLHYYSLFSCSHNCDIVVSIYSGGRYEVETKYTTMVDIASRPVMPRVETQELAKMLNIYELKYSKNSGISSDKNNDNNNTNSSTSSSNVHDEEGVKVWYGNRITDSGPLLRLEDSSRHLTKVERYGHPFERPIYPSNIPADIFESIVLSYFRHAYIGVSAKYDWSWSELHSFNAAIDWTAWNDSNFNTAE